MLNGPFSSTQEPAILCFVDAMMLRGTLFICLTDILYWLLRVHSVIFGFLLIHILVFFVRLRRSHEVPYALELFIILDQIRTEVID